jgi:protein tyrosine phosphatase (PTP) superfamily phosphohydrolase (DUF442 family)
MDNIQNRFKVLIPILVVFYLAFVKLNLSFAGPQGESCESKIRQIETSQLTQSYPTKKYKHMHFGGTPKIEDLKKAKADGLIEVVIDVRGPSEVQDTYRGEVEALGLEYFHVPLMAEGKIDPRAAQKLEDLHKKTHSKKQLLHCASGNRAAAWFASHLVVKDKFSLDDAFKVARNLGLTKKDLETAVTEYVKTTQTP